MSIASIVYPKCQKVLPLTYDESLSYYEVLCKLRNKINEVIDTFNEYEEIINQLAEAIKDIDDMKVDIAELQSLVATIQTTLTDYLGRIETLEKAVSENSEDIVELRELISALEKLLNTSLDNFMLEVKAMLNNITFDYDEQIQLLALKINQIKVNVYSQLSDLKSRVDSIDTSVINPWWQELGRINQDEHAKKVYYDLADNVPNAIEYCKTGLTADEYSALQIRAREYARNGKKLIHADYVYSPTFGWKQEISNVLTSILNACQNTITAERYTGLNYTAEEYTNIGLTAFEYYSFNPETLGLYSSNGVLQSDQFALTVDNNGVLEIHGADFVETAGVLSAEDT